MAEVVEINLVCKEVLKYDILLEFINKNIDNCYGVETIKAMDNWGDDTSIEIDSKEILDCLFNNKIICITGKTNSGFAGIDIERIESVINYTVWFNQEKYDILSEYYNLINNFLLFIEQEIKNKFVLCAIGKEVVFDFQNDYTRLFKTCHNIDIWINMDIELTDTILQKYEKFTVDNYTVLKKRNIDIIL